MQVSPVKMVVIGDVDLDELYVAKIPYNGTGDTGGDPMVDNLNIWYEVRSDSSQLRRCVLPLCVFCEILTM